MHVSLTARRYLTSMPVSMQNNIHVVIMAGGVGSRLFPLSTPERPKQFIDLLGCGETLIQLTYRRFAESCPGARFWVVTSAAYVHFIHGQLPDIPDEQILAEPVARNTAPCIAYACRKIRCKYPDAMIAVTPADAYVPDHKAFGESIREALGFAAGREAVVCVGITPTRPDTEYGYIKAPVPAAAGNVRKVDTFKEKPSREVAEGYLAEGGYYWNAGIFVWSASTIEAQLRRFAPQIAGVMDSLEPSLYTPGEEAAITELFPTCDKISIDYAVMEKSPDAYVAVVDWEWSDLGSFAAIQKITGRDPLEGIEKK